MKNLVPYFILQRYAKKEYHGHFHAVGLFVDLSGFTVTTETLLQHGQQGAEDLAGIMRSVFTPLVQSIYEHGGMITGFAGDAFTALFPMDNQDQGEDVRLYAALRAAKKIQQVMAASRNHTALGHSFTFAVKLGLAEGQVEWGIMQAPNPGQRHAYYFRGEAIEGAATAEKQAEQGAIILSPQLGERYKHVVTAEPAADHLRVLTIIDNLPAAPGISLPEIDNEQRKPFLPPELIDIENPGEFRDVFTVFLGIGSTSFHEELAAVMGLIFDLQFQYGGYLNGIDFGDKGCNLLFFWGAPTAHENDADRVMNFLLRLKQEATFEYRVGVTYQLMYAGQVGSDLRHDYSCYGRGINLAARQMMKAGWGELWADQRTYEKVHAGFRLSLVEQISFKGFAEKMPVYAITGREDSEILRSYKGGMIGRKHELNQLEQIFAPIREGRFAGGASIIGEPGMGKSRLADAFKEEQDTVYGDSFNWFLCPADEIIRGSFNPFRHFLKRYFFQSEAASEAVNKEHFAGKFQALIAQVPDPGIRQELERTESLLGALLGLFRPGSLYDKLDPKLRFENTLSALKNLFVAESLIRPLIIELEDSHWLDSDSKQFIRFLTRNIEAYPIAILIVSRDPEDSGLLDSQVDTREFQLSKFDRENTRCLAHDILGTDVDDSLVELLWQKTGGNPFFAEQMVRYLFEQEMLVPTEHGLAPRKTDLVVPDDVRAVITARLDRLSPSGKKLVQTASVLGREFDQTILAGMREKQSEKDAIEVSTEELNKIWQALDEIRYMFHHALMRDSVYNMQLLAELKKLHLAAAEVIESLYSDDLQFYYSDLAYHFEMAEAKAKTVEYYEKAADLAKNDYQNEQALSHYDKLLDWLDDGEKEKRFAVLLKKGSILELIGRWGEAEVVYREASDIAEQLNDRIKIVQTCRKLGWRFFKKGDHKKAVEYFEKALASSRAANDETGISIVMGKMGIIHMRAGDYGKAEECFREDLVLSEKLGHTKGVAYAFGNLGDIHFRRGNFDQAMEYYAKRLRIFQELGERSGISMAHGGLGDVNWRRGDYAQAMVCYNNKLELAEELGDLHNIFGTLVNMGTVFSEKGEFDQALSYLERAENVARQLGDQEGIAKSARLIGAVYRKKADYENAIVWLKRAEEFNRELNDTEEISIVYYNMGYTYQKQGDGERAMKYFQLGLKLSEDIGNKTGICINLGRMGSLHRTEGEPKKAIASFDQAIRMSRELGLRFWLSSFLIEKAEQLYELEQYVDAGALNSEGLQIAEEMGNSRNYLQSKELAEKIDRAQSTP